MTSKGRKPFTTEELSRSQALRCSFCNKSQAEVRNLIAGPDVFICDECVDICLKIIGPVFEAEDDLSPAAEGTEGVSVLLCNLCRLPTPVDQLTSIPQRGALCRACIDAVRRVTDPSSEVGS